MVPAPSIQATSSHEGTPSRLASSSTPINFAASVRSRCFVVDLPEADDSDDQREDPERRQGPIQHALGNALAGEEQAAAPV